MKKKLWLIHTATTTISIATPEPSRKPLRDRENAGDKMVLEGADINPVIHRISNEKEIVVISLRDDRNQYHNTCTITKAFTRMRKQPWQNGIGRCRYRSVIHDLVMKKKLWLIHTATTAINIATHLVSQKPLLRPSFKTLIKSNTQEEKSQIRSQNSPIKIVKIQSLSLSSIILQT